MSMRATYDPEAQALVVEFDNAPVVETVAFPDASHLADLDADGHVVALELLTEEPQLTVMADRFGFVDRLPEVRRAVQYARRAATSTRTAGTIVWSTVAAPGASTTAGSPISAQEHELEFA